jgi:AhpD family alkylhydroperoxidase
MPTPIDYAKHSPEALQHMRGLNAYLGNAALGATLKLVFIRVSQINGCNYCIVRHAREGCAPGESEARLSALSEWRSSTLFDTR